MTMIDEQWPPHGDQRYRTHRSVKCYLANLVVGTGGGTWYLNESIERVVHRFPDGTEHVVYYNDFYPLQPPERMAEIVKRHLALKAGPIVAGNVSITALKRTTLKPYPFIDISAASERAKLDAILLAQSQKP